MVPALTALDKSSLSERGICTKFITPAIEAAGWDIQTQMREKVYFTKGQVIVRGKTIKRGVEKRPLPHLLCTTNMLLHGVDVPSNVRHDNTLARPLRDHGPRDRVDAIVTNSPFGGMEEDGIESNFPKTFRTRETADLFLVLIMHLLKPGGRSDVVVRRVGITGQRASEVA